MRNGTYLFLYMLLLALVLGGCAGTRHSFQTTQTQEDGIAEDLLDYDIYEAISAYKKDVLLIHGDADSIVPLSYSEKAVEAYDSALLEVLPGAGHGFYGSDAEQAVDWMQEYLEAHKQ